MSTATLDQAKHLLVLLGQKNPSKEDLTALFKSGLFSDLLDADLSKVDRDEFRKLLRLHPLDMRIHVDCDLPFSEMVTSCSCGWIGKSITPERFPVLGKGKKTLRVDLFPLDRDLSPENATLKVVKSGVRPAVIEELIAFGAAFPEVQRRFRVFALGSSQVTRGSYDIPYLGIGSEGRSLDLLSCSVLEAGCRILVVYE